MRINVRFELLAIAFEHIIYNNGDEINSEFVRDYCSGLSYEVFSDWLFSYVFLPLHILTF